MILLSKRIIDYDEKDLIKENQMSRQVIHTENAPAAIGTYSQAILVGNTLYLSGQIGLDPYSMELVDGIEAQIRRVFDNLKAVCEAAGGTLADIAKLNIFLTDLSNFQLVSKLWANILLNHTQLVLHLV